MPNLVMQRLSITPDSVVLGEAFAASADVVNIGGTVSQNTRVRLEIDAGNDGQDVYYSGTLRLVPSLDAGGRFAVRWSTDDVPQSLRWQPVVGTHRVKLCVDVDSSIPESIYLDNCVSGLLTVTHAAVSSSSASSSTASSYSSGASSPSPGGYQSVPVDSGSASSASTLPDFDVIDLSVVPASGSVGQDFVISATVINRGYRSFDATRARLAIDTGITGQNIYYSGFLRAVSPLATNGRASVRWGTQDSPRSISWVPVAGVHRVTVCVNVDSAIPEANHDHCASFDFRLSATGSSSSPVMTTPTVDSPRTSSSFSSSASSVSASASSSAAPWSSSSSSAPNLPDIRIYSITVQPGNPGKAMVVTAVRILFSAGASVLGVPTSTIVQYRLNDTDGWTTTGVPRSIAPLVRSGQYEVAEWTDLGQASANEPFVSGARVYFRTCADSTNVVPERYDDNNCSAGFPVTVR